MEIKNKTKNTQRQKSAGFGFFENKSRSFKTGSGPRCSAAKKNKQRKILVENNKTFEKSKMAAKKVPITVSKSLTYCDMCQYVSDHETRFCPSLKCLKCTKLGHGKPDCPLKSDDEDEDTEEMRPAPQKQRPTSNLFRSAGMSSRLRARHLNLDLSLVQPSPGPRPNRYRFSQRPERPTTHDTPPRTARISD